MPGRGLAHSALTSSTPAADAVLSTPPSEIVLRFSEAVEGGSGEIRVLGTDGRELEVGPARADGPVTLRAALPDALPRGSYAVSWRVVSADTHPVAGAFVFSVGERSRDAASLLARAGEGQDAPPAVDRAFDVVQFAGFLLILGVAGGVAALTLVLVGITPPAAERRVLAGIVILAAVLVPVTLAGLGLQGARTAGGGFDAAFDADVLGDVLDTRFGGVWLGRLVLALVVVVAAVAVARLRRGRELVELGLLLPAALLLCTTPGLSGHARAEGALAVAVDTAHVVAAAAWTGGLAFLLVALATARSSRWDLAAGAVPRFSALAVGSVVVLLSAGTASTLLELDRLSDLWSTTWGQLVLVKIALVVPLLALGAYNNRVSVPRLRKGTLGAPEQRRFVRSAVAELGLVVVVVGVTAALVTQPPRTAQAEAAPAAAEAVSHGPYNALAQVGERQVQLTVEPAETGANVARIHLTRAGKPVRIAEARLLATLPSEGLGPLRLRTRVTGPGRARVDTAALPLPGTWELRAELRVGEFELVTSTFNVPVGASHGH